MCTITTTVPIPGLTRNTLLRFGNNEYTNIVSVTNGPDGTSSFRCSTVTTQPQGRALNAAVNGNVRVFLTGTHAAGEVLLGLTMEAEITKGVGTMAFNAAGSTSYNFKIIGGRPISADDYIHLSVWMDKPDMLVEGKLILGVDAASTSSYNEHDATRNAYVRTFRPNDYQDTIQNLATADVARTKALQLQQQDNSAISQQSTLQPDNPFGIGGSSNPADVANVAESQPPITPDLSSTGQMVLGESQWCEFRWRVADFIRLGAQQSRDWAQVKAIQVVFNVSDTVNVQIADLWIGGTYGPDTGPNLTPIIYRSRYRSSVTGAKSIPGPAMRSGIQSLRQGVSLTCLGSTDPQVDKVDWERLGGQNLEWHYIGTSENDDTDPVEFVDEQLSAAVVVNPALDITPYVPFPVIQRPRLINVNMIGTAIEAAPTEFDVNWAKGVTVKINGRVSSLYMSPDSDSVLHLADNVGSGAALMEINEPIAQGTPMPYMWGPYYNSMFSSGAASDAGAVYFTNGNNPDGASPANRIEVTAPSERQMGGCTYDTKAFSFSDQRLFSIVPAFDTPNKFTFVEVPNGKGLFSPWALAVGPKIWFLSSDGIYETTGGEPVKVSGALDPIFPQGEKGGVVTNGVYPPKMVRGDAGSQALYLRLSYHQGYLYFDYRDINDQPHTLVMDTQNNAWYFDYNFGATNPPKAINCRFSESTYVGGDVFKNLLCGSNFGYAFLAQGQNDDTLGIPGAIWTPTPDFGDPRAKKVYGDSVIGVNPAGASVVVNGYIDNFQTLVGTQTVTGSTRITSDPMNINGGVGVFGRNFGLKITWNGVAIPTFYYWSPSFLERPEDTFTRADDWTDGGYAGSKLVRGFLVEYDTEGGSKAFSFDADQTTRQNYTAGAAGQQLIAYAVTPPQIGSLLRLHPTTEVMWREFRVSYLYDKYPENAAIQTDFDDGGNMDAKFVQGVLVEGLGSDPNLAVLRDNSVPVLTLNMAQGGSTLGIVPYSWPVPFIAHTMALRPTVPVRLGRVKWIYEPVPELAENWITQGTDHGIDGWQFLKDCYFPYISTALVRLVVNVDGTDFTFMLPSTGGQYRKEYFIFSQLLNGRTLKGKLFTYKAYSATAGVGFRLYKKDMEVRVHPWNGGDYVSAKPFGGPHRADGAKI